MWKDPFYDYDGDYDDPEEGEEVEDDRELDDDWREATDAEYDRIADIYERGIYGD